MLCDCTLRQRTQTVSPVQVCNVASTPVSSDGKDEAEEGEITTRHLYTTTRAHLPAATMRQHQNMHVLHKAMEDLERSLTAFLYTDEHLLPANLCLARTHADFSVLVTLPRALPHTTKWCQVDSFLATNQLAVVQTSAIGNNCLIFSIVKSMIQSTSTLGYDRSGDVPSYLHVWKDAVDDNPTVWMDGRSDHLLLPLVRKVRLGVAAWLTNNRDALLDRWTHESDAHTAKAWATDLDKEIAKASSGQFLSTLSWTAAVTVLRDMDHVWWDRVGFKVIYYGGCHAEDGLKDLCTHVLPMPDMCEAPTHYKNAITLSTEGVKVAKQLGQSRDLWNHRTQKHLNSEFGIKVPTRQVLECEMCVGPHTCLFTNVVQGRRLNSQSVHFEAVLRVPHNSHAYVRAREVTIWQDAQSGLHLWTKVPRYGLNAEQDECDLDSVEEDVAKRIARILRPPEVIAPSSEPG